MKPKIKSKIKITPVCDLCFSPAEKPVYVQIKSKSAIGDYLRSRTYCRPCSDAIDQKADEEADLLRERTLFGGGE